MVSRRLQQTDVAMEGAFELINNVVNWVAPAMLAAYPRRQAKYSTLSLLTNQRVQDYVNTIPCFPVNFQRQLVEIERTWNLRHIRDPIPFTSLTGTPRSTRANQQPPTATADNTQCRRLLPSLSAFHVAHPNSPSPAPPTPMGGNQNSDSESQSFIDALSKTLSSVTITAPSASTSPASNSRPSGVKARESAGKGRKASDRHDRALSAGGSTSSVRLWEASSRVIVNGKRYSTAWD